MKWNGYTRLCQINNITVWDAANNAGLAPITVQKWRKGESKPKIESLLKLFRYFASICVTETTQSFFEEVFEVKPNDEVAFINKHARTFEEFKEVIQPIILENSKTKFSKLQDLQMHTIQTRCKSQGIIDACEVFEGMFDEYLEEMKDSPRVSDGIKEGMEIALKIITDISKNLQSMAKDQFFEAREPLLIFQFEEQIEKLHKNDTQMYATENEAYAEAYLEGVETAIAVAMDMNRLEESKE